MQRHSAHVEAIELVARRLSELGMEVVFTGGAIVGLYSRIVQRPTSDRPTMSMLLWLLPGIRITHRYRRDFAILVSSTI